LLELKFFKVKNDEFDIKQHYISTTFQNLAAEKTYNNLDVTLKEANEHRNEWFEGVHTCKRDDSLFAVMETIVKAEVHRLVIIDGEGKVCGVVSLSDILSFLVLRPSGMYYLLYDFLIILWGWLFR
jgi:CBS-domain-containing membrane protein